MSRDLCIASLVGLVFLVGVGGTYLYQGHSSGAWDLAEFDSLLAVADSTVGDAGTTTPDPEPNLAPVSDPAPSTNVDVEPEHPLPVDLPPLPMHQEPPASEASVTADDRFETEVGDAPAAEPVSDPPPTEVGEMGGTLELPSPPDWSRDVPPNASSASDDMPNEQTLAVATGIEPGSDPVPDPAPSSIEKSAPRAPFESTPAEHDAAETEIERAGEPAGETVDGPIGDEELPALERTSEASRDKAAESEKEPDWQTRETDVDREPGRIAAPVQTPAEPGWQPPVAALDADAPSRQEIQSTAPTSARPIIAPARAEAQPGVDPRVIARAVPIEAEPQFERPVAVATGGSESVEPIPHRTVPIAVSKSQRHAGGSPGSRAVEPLGVELADQVAPESTYHAVERRTSPSSEEFYAVQQVAHQSVGEADVTARRAAPSRTAGVQVDAYDVETYVVLAGDSFDAIAERMYNSGEYGPALLRYNRAKVARDAPLPPGRRILLPPARILQRESANLRSESFQPIERPGDPIAVAPTDPPTPLSSSRLESMQPALPPAAPLPVEPSAAAASRAESSAPAPIARSESPPPDPTPADNREPSAPECRYAVEQEQTLYAIARLTLGDGRRWPEIYNLNRDRLASEFELVPAGITLRLPPDAKPPSR